MSLENKPTQEIPIVYKPMTGGHLDQNTVISSLSALATELPTVKRTIGYPVWVNDIKRHYIFKDGILDSNFVPQEATNPDHTPRLFAGTVNLTANSKSVIQHNMNTQNVVIECMYNNESILLDKYLGDANGSNLNNCITLKSTITISNVKVTISAKL